MSDEDSQRSNARESFLHPSDNHTGCLKYLQKLDFFSFIPVPKDEPVSTRRSIIGSTVFILLFLAYVIVDAYQFITDNPPIVENSYQRLNEDVYTLPRVAITFMKGEDLNESFINPEVFSFKCSKEMKGNNFSNKTEIGLSESNGSYLEDWLNDETISFYDKLLTPTEVLTAKGLLYSTETSNYSKISVSVCDLNDHPEDCLPFDNVTDLMAQGRIFLFIEYIEDESLPRRLEKSAKFTIANFFLMTKIYKRVTVSYQVVKTTLLPDYFHRFTEKYFMRLELDSITEAISNVTANDYRKNLEPLNMLGINFQLSPQMMNVRVSYVTLLDHVSKWGAFFNVLFAVFALFFLAYNKNKFYKKNPDWDRFKKRENQVYKFQGQEEEQEIQS